MRIPQPIINQALQHAVDFCLKEGDPPEETNITAFRERLLNVNSEHLEHQVIRRPDYGSYMEVSNNYAVLWLDHDEGPPVEILIAWNGPATNPKLNLVTLAFDDNMAVVWHRV